VNSLENLLNPFFGPNCSSFYLGCFLSLILGWIFTGTFVTYLRHWLNEGKWSEFKNWENMKECSGFNPYPSPDDPCESPPVRRIPQVVTGTIERMFFTTCVAFNVPGTAVAMMAWIAAKMATRWLQKERVKKELRTLPLSAILGNITSMSFALWGGLLIRHSLGL